MQTGASALTAFGARAETDVMPIIPRNDKSLLRIVVRTVPAVNNTKEVAEQGKVLDFEHGLECKR